MNVPQSRPRPEERDVLDNVARLCQIDRIAGARVRVGRRLDTMEVLSLRDGMTSSSRRYNSRADANQRCNNDGEHRRQNCSPHKTLSPRLITHDANQLYGHLVSVQPK